MEKYRLLRERVGAELPSVDLREPVALPDSVIALAHDSDYIHRLVHGDLSRNEIQKMGFPWSVQMVERSRRSAGATVEACRAAIRDGAAVNLAGGTHHAYANRGEGFCCFNDAIIAARVVQREFGGREGIRRIAVVDLDVHQGNGNAALFQNSSNAFTFSVHCKGNYFSEKQRSDLDIEVNDGFTPEERRKNQL
jgi:acetoin utilization deacetylase AcuC-like enzyme